MLAAKQQFIYDAQGHINEVHGYAPHPTTGVLQSGSMDIYLSSNNELWVNSIMKSDGTLYSHSAYKFDGQGRTIQTKYQFLTENHVYTNHYTKLSNCS